ncbi:hypothetical protein U1Q18_032606 [Sarracenia purpurea var. burkii]
MDKLKPVKGLYKLKKWVEDRGLKRAAVTNAPKENAELMISALGLSDFVILGSDCEHGKPFPDPYLNALELLKVSNDHTFIFELPGFLSSHAFEEDEEEDLPSSLFKEAVGGFPVEPVAPTEELETSIPTPNDKRHYILEDVDGELEMEDVSAHPKDGRPLVANGSNEFGSQQQGLQPSLLPLQLWASQQLHQSIDSIPSSSPKLTCQPPLPHKYCGTTSGNQLIDMATNTPHRAHTDAAVRSEMFPQQSPYFAPAGACKSSGDEAELEMEEEEQLLRSLGWKGKGLIQSAYDAESNGSPCMDNADDNFSGTNFGITTFRESFTHKLLKDGKKEGSLRFYKQKFSYIFCDMDDTLLNSQSQITSTTAKALREASSRGVRVVIATGKTRPAAISALKRVDLAGKDGIVSEFSPGVFLQVHIPLQGIRDKFLQAQEISDARVMWDQKTGSSRGFRFVSFRNQQAVDDPQNHTCYIEALHK